MSDESKSQKDDWDVVMKSDKDTKDESSHAKDSSAKSMCGASAPDNVNKGTSGPNPDLEQITGHHIFRHRNQNHNCWNHFLEPKSEIYLHGSFEG